MRALLDLDVSDPTVSLSPGGPRPLATALGELRAREAAELIVLSDGERLGDPQLLRSFAGLRGLRARVTLASLDPARERRLAERLRGLARAAPHLPIDVVLPIAEGLSPAAARLVGLAHAVPKLSRFLLEAIPDRPLVPREPDALEREIDEVLEAARELKVTALLDDQCRVDTELVSLRAGLKPVIRLSTPGDETALVARYRALGLSVVAADGLFVDDEGQHNRKLRLVYVAPTLAAAEHAAAVEQKTFVKSPDLLQRAADYEALGLVLGYPPCCVAAYAKRVILEHPEDGTYVAEAHVCARGAFTSRPHWELNHFLLETGDSVVPFAPCRYDCPAGLALARAIFARVSEEAPLAARKIRGRLAVALAVDAKGARAVLELDGDLVRAARPRRTSRGGLVHQADIELARGFTGESLAQAFREGADQPVLLRFDLS